MNSFICINSLIVLLIFQVTANAQIDRTLVLNGYTDYIEFPENELMDFDQVLSIECWVQPNCAEGEKVLVSKQRCGDDFGYYLSVVDGKLSWTFSVDGSCNSLNTFQTVNSSIPTDAFTHVAVVHSQFNVKLFINGIQAVAMYTLGGFGTIANSEEPFLIGCYQQPDGNMTDFYSGQIDELRVWNIQLTGSLIQQRMESPLEGNEAGLVAYLNMEQSGQGSTLFLVNQSSIGGFIDASPIGFTPFSPYTIHFQDYGEGTIDLGEDINTCDGPVSLSISAGNYHSVLWSTGSIGNAINVSNSGTYVVSVETELCKFYADTIQVEFSDYVLLTQVISICENDTLWVGNNLFFEAGIYQDTLTTNSGACDTIQQYLIIENLSVSEYIQVETCTMSTFYYEGESLAPGSITQFSFSASNGCDSVVTIEVLPTLILEDTVNFTVCEGTSVEYNSTILTADSETAFYFESVEGCDSIVTVRVNTTQPYPDFLGSDTTICEEYLELISPSENTSWSTGAYGGSLTVKTSGTYSATFTDEDDCLNSDTIVVEFINMDIYVPNAFSPNGDGINDCFQPFFPIGQDYENYRLSVLDRWGELVFQSTDQYACWDGHFRGELLPAGVYIWFMEEVYGSCDGSGVLKGEVLLVR